MTCAPANEVNKMAEKKARDAEKLQLEKLRAFQKSNQWNKRCADCTEIGPTYVCMDFGTFVCTMCSGLHRELHHKVKGVSVSKWSPTEVEFVEKHGNEAVRADYMAAWNPKDYPEPDGSDPAIVRKFLRMKYVDKLWCPPDPSKGWGLHKDDSEGEPGHKESSSKKEHKKKKKPRESHAENVTPKVSTNDRMVEDLFALKASQPPWDVQGSSSPKKASSGWATFDISTTSGVEKASKGWEATSGESLVKASCSPPFDPFQSEPKFQSASARDESVFTVSSVKNDPAFTAVPPNDLDFHTGSPFSVGAASTNQAFKAPIIQNDLDFYIPQGSGSSSLQPEPSANQRYSGDPFHDIVETKPISESSPAMSLQTQHAEAGLTPLEHKQRALRAQQQYLMMQMLEIQKDLESSHSNTEVSRVPDTPSPTGSAGAPFAISQSPKPIMPAVEPSNYGDAFCPSDNPLPGKEKLENTFDSFNEPTDMAKLSPRRKSNAGLADFSDLLLDLNKLEVGSSSPKKHA